MNDEQLIAEYRKRVEDPDYPGAKQKKLELLEKSLVKSAQVVAEEIAEQSKKPGREWLIWVAIAILGGVEAYPYVLPIIEQYVGH